MHNTLPCLRYNVNVFAKRNAFDAYKTSSIRFTTFEGGTNCNGNSVLDGLPALDVTAVIDNRPYTFCFKLKQIDHTPGTKVTAEADTWIVYGTTYGDIVSAKDNVDKRIF